MVNAMPKFAANLSMLYPELDFLDRFAAAARDGFALLDELGYGGWVGCEYRPREGMIPGGTSAGLAWLGPYL